MPEICRLSFFRTLLFSPHLSLSIRSCLPRVLVCLRACTPGAAERLQVRRLVDRTREEGRRASNQTHGFDWFVDVAVEIKGRRYLNSSPALLFSRLLPSLSFTNISTAYRHDHLARHEVPAAGRVRPQSGDAGQGGAGNRRRRCSPLARLLRRRGCPLRRQARRPSRHRPGHAVGRRGQGEAGRHPGPRLRRRGEGAGKEEGEGRGREGRRERRWRGRGRERRRGT